MSPFWAVVCGTIAGAISGTIIACAIMVTVKMLLERME